MHACVKFSHVLRTAAEVNVVLEIKGTFYREVMYPVMIDVIDFASFQGYNGVGYTERSIIMKRLFCLLLALSLAIPTFALAVSS